MLSIASLYEAKQVLNGIVRTTPLISASRIAENLHIKTENLQKTGSFKLRGAYYKMSTLTVAERERGVIACSAGNHAQGVAFAASQMGVRSTICIPLGAPLSKVEATRGYGGEVVLVPGVYDDAYAKAKELEESCGYCFIHPFDDEAIIAGQGTIGLEILEQLPNADAIVVPIGGGGLISGIGVAIKSMKPSCKVIGVQANGAPSMAHSRQAEKPVTLEQVATIADGIAVKRPGNLTFSLCQQFVDEIVTVTDDEISAAILTLMEREKTVAEGAGAVAVAAVMAGKAGSECKNVVSIVSGGNIDVNILSRVIDRGLVTSGRLMRFTTQVDDKPGQLIGLLQVASDCGANVLSVSHNRKSARIGSCLVDLELETRDHRHIDAILDTFEKKGYLPPVDPLDI